MADSPTRKCEEQIAATEKDNLWGSSEDSSPRSLMTPSPDTSRSRSASRRRHEGAEMQVQSSTCLGPMLEFLSDHAKSSRDELLTILASRHDDNAAIWEGYGSLTNKCRVFYFEDAIIVREAATFVEREININIHTDTSYLNPTVVIAQRLYDSNGRVQLVGHRLSFGSRIDLDQDYIFPALGDEILGHNGPYPALHCAFRAIEHFGEYSMSGQFLGCDRNITIEVPAEDLKSGGRITYDVSRDAVVKNANGKPTKKPALGVSIQARDLASLLLPDEENCHAASRKRGRIAESFCIRVIGGGPEIQGHGFRADLNVRFRVI